MADDEKPTENPNLAGIVQTLTEYGFARHAEGADGEEVRTWGTIAMYLSALAGAVSNGDFTLVEDLVYGDISSIEAAEALGWA